MNSSIKKFTIAFSFLLLAFSVANGQGQGIEIDKIIGKVDNYIIQKSELEVLYNQVLASNQNLGPNGKCEILRSLVLNKVMLAKAELDSVIVDDNMIEGELDRRMQMFIMQAGDENKLEQQLGKSIPELKEGLRDQLRDQMTVQKMRQEITATATITPAEVKKYYNSLPKDSIPFLAAEVKVGQIIIFPEVSRVEKSKVKNKLLDVKAQIEAGEDFTTFCRQYSEDYGSRARGGDLGWASRGQMVPEFEAAALRLEPGELSDPIESDFGYHLIQLLERRGNKYHARHILIRPKSNASDLKGALHKMDSIKQLIKQDTLTFEEAAKEFSEDQITRSNSGYFVNPETGQALVPTDKLEPVIFFALDTMQLGTLSAPMEYRTDDGKKAVRMLYYESHTEPHYADLKRDYQKLYIRALAEKNDKVLNDWLKKAKDDVYIDIDSEYDYCNLFN